MWQLCVVCLLCCQTVLCINYIAKSYLLQSAVILSKFVSVSDFFGWQVNITHHVIRHDMSVWLTMICKYDPP